MPDEINFTAARLAWDILQSLCLLGLFIWTVIDRRRAANSTGISQMVRDMHRLERRVQKLEDALANLPTHHDLNTIKVEMARLTTQIKGLDHKLEVIHQYILNREGRP